MSSAIQDSASTPLVSVVTPFYNTAQYLRECIESVLAQTRRDFEYVLYDNHSDDGSREIAEEYAARDARIRIGKSPRHLTQLDNFNHALREISSASRYVKMVLADDWLFPECLERMVEVAERRDSIAIVSAYYLTDLDVRNTGLPYRMTVMSGREACRRTFLDNEFFFGSPSSVLYRADLVRKTEAFFDASALHADTERVYQLLRDHDFGFVHQILSYMRLGNEGISSSVINLFPHHLDKLIVLIKFGRDFLEPDELRRCMERYEHDYYHAYLRGRFGPNRDQFVRYHRAALDAVGYRFSKGLMVRVAAEKLLNLTLNPQRTLARAAKRFGLRGRSV